MYLKKLLYRRPGFLLAILVVGIISLFHSLWLLTSSQKYRPNIKSINNYRERKNRIMFLKTHKTGSMTVTNILNRYGTKYNLTFALPKNIFTAGFDWPKRLTSRAVLNLWASPHILCNHARYSKRIIRHLFPKPPSTYITILREPLVNYESAINYMKLWKHMNIPGNDSMDILKEYLLSVTNMKSANINLADRSRLLRNPMMHDLGLDFRYYQDAKAISEYIKFLDKEFDLVMITEYFSESLVLLKRLMGWDFDDVVFVKHNERKEIERKKLSPILKANIKSWNKADFLLYDHFNNTLWRKIAAEGEDFYKDLALFKKRQQEVYEMCISPNLTIIEIYIGKFVKGHDLKKDIPEHEKIFCENLVKSELTFYRENWAFHHKRQAWIDDPGDFKDESDKENDWDKSKDYEHIPIHFAEAKPSKMRPDEEKPTRPSQVKPSHTKQNQTQPAQIKLEQEKINPSAALKKHEPDQTNLERAKIKLDQTKTMKEQVQTKPAVAKPKTEPFPNKLQQARTKPPVAQNQVQTIQAKPDTAKGKPELIRTKPEPAQTKLKPIQTKPAAVENKPEQTQGKLQPVQSKLEQSQTKPEPAQTQPKTDTTKLDPAKYKAQTRQAKPDTTKAKSELATTKPEPALNKPDPVQTKSEPAQTKLEPTQTKPEQVQTKPEPPKPSLRKPNPSLIQGQNIPGPKQQQPSLVQPMQIPRKPKLSLQQLKLSPNQPPKNSNKPKPSSNHSKTNSNKLKPSFDKPKPSPQQSEQSTNQTKPWLIQSKPSFIRSKPSPNHPTPSTKQPKPSWNKPKPRQDISKPARRRQTKSRRNLFHSTKIFQDING